MNEDIYALKPERLWYWFGEILKIPRPSKKEEKIAAFIKKFGQDHGLETLLDEVGNLLIRKPASPGMEKMKMVALQSHIDMVCEKNADTSHDFEKDPIQAYVDEGWVKAKGTTLGADDGIGIATQLAILEADEIKHGPLECLFTIDEETGLTGAFGLKPGFLKSDILLNLDSEDDGELFIGCAGGKDTVIELPFEKEETPGQAASMKIMVSGLKGGHSGDDIHKGRGNANKILNRALWELANKFGVKVSVFNGGNLRNAIAREAYAVVAMDENRMKDVQAWLKEFENAVQNELHVTEPDLKVTFEKVDKASFVLSEKSQESLLNSLYACPHGVIAMSQEIPGFVETSTNLASVKTLEDHFLITTSQRSSVETAKDDICNMVAAVFRLTEARIRHTDGYPGWSPDPHSEIVDITVDSYKKLFGEEPSVRAVHAGLECGLIGDKYPGMDMISYGPTIRGAHSPDEKLEIDTVIKFWELTLDVLLKIPEK
jgi:dipeptidase D